MEIKRRNFLKVAGLAGFSALGQRSAKGADAKPKNSKADIPQLIAEFEKNHKQRFNMANYAAPPMDKVRIGIIGLSRGYNHLKVQRRIEGVEIKALCDLRPSRANGAKASLKKMTGGAHNPEVYTGSEVIWKKLCQRDDIDLVFVITPWYMHAEMAIYAMEQGKHVVSEVPAAGTIEECIQLVKTAERTRRHMMMMENYAYMPFQLLALNMAQKGVFGEIVHGAGAYIANKIARNFNKNCYWNMWWLKQYANRKGNIYPTHGLGPVALMMDINRGDRFDFVVSVESKDFLMGDHARELAKTDDFFKPYANKDFRGNINTSVIKTKQGKTIILQHDATTPSPHNLIHGIYGMKGSALYDPPPPRITLGGGWGSADKFKQKYTPAIFTKIGEMAKGSGHGGSDLILGWHLIDCLRNGLPLDQDVYDAAAWSSMVPLTEWSVLNNSNSIKVPDCTAGKWKKNKQNMDINLTNGGGTTKIIA